MFRPKFTLFQHLRCLLPIALTATAFCQVQPTFKTSVTDSTVANPRNTLAVDVNNDGLPDLITDSLQLPLSLRVRLANGSGGFSDGYSYTFPNQYQSPLSTATGDVNGDGKVDLVAALSGTSQIAVFLGNGDGSFQAPRYEEIGVVSTSIIFGTNVLLADFNRDGKLDLALVESSQLVIAPGNGDGSFAIPHVVQSVPANTGINQLGIGDFDADAKADIAFSETSNCQPGNCATVLHVLYGNGDFTFTDSTAFSSTDEFNFDTGDLNSDGRTDIFGTQPNSQHQDFLYATGSRTFALYTGAQQVNGDLALADVNGDGIMDVIGTIGSSTGLNMVVLTGTAQPGVFNRYAYPIGNWQYLSNPVVGDFVRDARPDIAIAGQKPSYYGQPAPPPSELFVAVDATPSSSTSPFTGGCNYPNKEHGISICSPASSSVTSPVHFNAAASSLGPLRKIELWIDDHKVAEQRHTWEHYGWFGFSTGAYTGGTHKATFYSADADNRLQRADFSFTVGSCSAPSTAGVNVCSPASGSTVGSPVAVQAHATITGTLARMEVWVDGVKKYTETTSTSLSTSIALGTGSHRFDIYAVNTAGRKWEKTVTATVK